MLSSDILKKVGKVISKFFLFNESIRRSEKSRDIKEADYDDDDGEDVRVLFSSSSDDGEDDDDDNDGDGSNDGDVGDDNNGAIIVLMDELIILKVICKG